MRRIYVELDDADHRDIVRAIARREQYDAADSDSNLDGKALAEICRSWMEYNDVEGE